MGEGVSALLCGGGGQRRGALDVTCGPTATAAWERECRRSFWLSPWSLPVEVLIVVPHPHPNPGEDLGRWRWTRRRAIGTPWTQPIPVQVPVAQIEASLTQLAGLLAGGWWAWVCEGQRGQPLFLTWPPKPASPLATHCHVPSLPLQPHWVAALLLESRRSVHI